MFGGVNRKNQYNPDELLMLCYSKRVSKFYFKTIRLISIDWPVSRIGFTFIFSKEQNWIILYGGKYKNQFLNDFWLFDIGEKIWIKK